MVANKLLTLVFVRKEAQILLGLKKRGFGEGRWNGFGGKVEKGETILEAAKRELNEESGLTAHSLEQIGVLKFEFVGKPQWLEVHVFHTRDYAGEPTETSEMRPQWYNIDSIPYDIMWPDDKQWFPLMLKEAKFNGYYLFEGMDIILKEDLKEVQSLDV
ncbi:oxidized purine nucleoside triphosphate hydrolase-like [Haliotis rufescens]|uniref:oxidized purine nucleoside triphosphate hydrolase-like n=1 Tax=Haliotis rufescens TaxID=6454 RepID=UPI001EB04A94|nr:oxidized purine nucleoside triphosphate hydrolase-like [Haliotis rufescens]XP_046352952.1 oxidized purine nucleoside triphosphate hydrolase-like [Haliotis rufescens]XP_046352954.1 oxidized purine nucleoside triphosphate hydrolase-like [Haliotis rufescens]